MFEIQTKLKLSRPGFQLTHVAELDLRDTHLLCGLLTGVKLPPGTADLISFEPQTQSIMMQNELLNDALQLRCGEPASDFEQQRLVEVMLLRQVLLEEIALDRSQSDFACRQTLMGQCGRHRR